MTRPPRILAVAGSDSSGGAGIQADVKTITMLGGYAMTAVTALTAQNTLGVMRIDAVEPAMVAAQIDACVSDIGVDAVKIGMLGSAAVAELVAERLEALAVPMVFDPVMIATSGAELADAETIAAFGRLIALATLTTPNLAELEALGGDAALMTCGVNYLAKGGDAEGATVIDRLVRADGSELRFAGSRIATRHTHGTGCTLSSAIATFLGQGLPLEESIDRARGFVRSALRAAPGFGAGAGPLGHQAARGALSE